MVGSLSKVAADNTVTVVAADASADPPVSAVTYTTGMTKFEDPFLVQTGNVAAEDDTQKWTNNTLTTWTADMFGF